MSSSLEINYEMQAYDRKDRSYYDNFTDEDRKKFSTYLMLKNGANVSGNKDLQAYYLMATNERVNKHFFDINRHPKLQWLICTTVSPGFGKQRHFWLASKKKDTNNNKAVKFLLKLYPYLKNDELELLASINDTKELKKLARDMGMSDADIKKELG